MGNVRSGGPVGRYRLSVSILNRDINPPRRHAVIYERASRIIINVVLQCSVDIIIYRVEYTDSKFRLLSIALRTWPFARLRLLLQHSSSGRWSVEYPCERSVGPKRIPH